MAPVSKAKQNDVSDVESFYRNVGEDVTLTSPEVVFVKKEGGQVIGAVRLTREHEVLVLRTLNVAPNFQRRGIGSQLVQKLVSELKGRKCFCLPYPHLKTFYHQFGFREVGPETLPKFLFERYSDYNKSFSVIAMERRATK